MSPEEIETLLAEAERENAREMTEWVEAIRCAEGADSEKERFDILLLRRYYDPYADRAEEWRPDLGRDLRLEYRYWVRYPLVRTVKEFAEILNGILADGES